MLRKNLIEGSKWFHLKLKHLYVLVCLSIDSDSLKERVVYKRFHELQNDLRIWDKI
jgi:hypothetical protein